MRFRDVGVISLCAMQAAALGLESFADYASDIPSCSFPYFTKATKKAGCSVSPVNSDTVKCMCSATNLQRISFNVGTTAPTSSPCAIDFAQPFGSICGLWIAQGTSADGFDDGLKTLASIFSQQSTSSNSSSSSSPFSGTGDDDSNPDDTTTTPMSGSSTGSAAPDTPKNTTLVSTTGSATAKTNGAAAVSSFSVGFLTVAVLVSVAAS